MLHLPLKHCHSAMFCQNEYGIKSLKIDDSYFHAFSIQTSSQSSVDVIATNKMAHNRTARLLVLLGIQAHTARLHFAPLGSNCIHLGPLGSRLVQIGPLGSTGSTWVHLGPHGLGCGENVKVKILKPETFFLL